MAQKKNLIQKSKKTLQSKFDWLLSKFMRRMWVKSTAYSLLGIGVAVLGLWVKRYLPENFGGKVSHDAVNTLLTIVATSMLSVVIFSLSTIVTAFGTQNSNATPRATILLAENSTAQNTLSVFLGAFIYSLAGLFLLNFGNDDNDGRVVLYVTTILMVAWVVLALVKWIDYTLAIGRISVTTDLVEEHAIKALKERCDNPFMGGSYWSGKPKDLPAGAVPVYINGLKYVQFIDIPALEELTKNHSIQIYVNLIPGDMAHEGKPVAHLLKTDKTAVSDEEKIATLATFSVGDERSFDHDPRFGLCALSEIGSKALSAAINDPGTSIDVLNSITQVMAQGRVLFANQHKKSDGICLNVFVPPLTSENMFDDAYNAIARDGAGEIEVVVHLQKMLHYLASLNTPQYVEGARKYAHIALERSLIAITDKTDQARSRSAAAPLLATMPSNKRTLAKRTIRKKAA